MSRDCSRHTYEQIYVLLLGLNGYAMKSHYLSHREVADLSRLYSTISKLRLKLLSWSLFQTFHIKLVDFGFARILLPGKELRVTEGTPEFVSPEVIDYQPVTLTTDMWSVGVLTYVLLSGLSPFRGKDNDVSQMDYASC